MNNSRALAWDLYVMGVDRMLDMQQKQYAAGENPKPMLMLAPTQAEANVVELAFQEERIKAARNARMDMEDEQEEKKNAKTPEQSEGVVDTPKSNADVKGVDK